MGGLNDMNGIKVVVFDLDDTLYSELDYVRSGLKFVANNFSGTLQVQPNELYKLFLKSLEMGRSHIFNRVFDELLLNSSKNVERCVSLYRCHTPDISLYPESLNVLKKVAKQYPVYIVTDGNKLVQERKLRALGLYESPLIKKSYITYRFGLKNAKPSPYCFNKIASQEKIKTDELVYIADNPKKDFVGINPLGYKTIRIRSGQHKDCYYGDEYEAEYIVNTLTDVLKYLRMK